MSLSIDGIKLTKSRTRRWGPVVLVAEAVLSIFVYMSFSAHLLWPDPSRGATGVASMLSYEGRLMDASGNPLGGTGTPYCFRFSIYDAATGGTKLWPAGTPATTMATSTDGVFNALIGQADALTYNFYDSDTVFLNVDVNTTASTCAGSWETLSPRQRIAATGYARSAENVYSSLFATDVNNNRVQVGTGVGGGSPKFLGLDVKNTNDYIGQSCTTSGTLWYNSAISKALVCENGVIQAVSNASATSTIAGVTANTGTPASSGTIVFSNANGVTFGINGQTITASVAAGGGGGGATLSHWPPFPVGLATSSNNTGATAAGTNITASFHVAPLQLHQAVSYSRINLIGSFGTVAGTGSVSLAHMLGIYTLNAGTALSLVTSYMFRNEISQNSVTALSHRWYWGTNSAANSSSSGGNFSANVTGLRMVPMFVSAGGSSLAAGQYYVVYAQTNRSSASNVFPAATIMYISESQSTAMGAGQIASAATLPPMPLIGQFSSTTTAGNFTTPFMPSSINTTVITNTGGSSQWKWPFVQFLGK